MRKATYAAYWKSNSHVLNVTQSVNEITARKNFVLRDVYKM